MGRPIGMFLIVAYKGFWGMAEIFAGILLMLSRRLVGGELAEDPEDLFANWMLAHLHIT